MRKLVYATGLTLVILGIAGSASAQTVVNVTATVGASCIPIAPGSFYFGIDDPDVVTPATSIVAPTVQCTNDAFMTISYVSANNPASPEPCFAGGSGAHGILVQDPPGTDQIDYNFDCGTGDFLGKGIAPSNRALDVSLTLDGNVSAGAAATASPGTYTDTITLTFGL